MTGDQQIWQSWARMIHRWGLEHLVTAFLETAGPITILGAQIVYLSQPLLQQVFRTSHLTALASMLEDPLQTRGFLELLNQEHPA